MSNFTGTGLLQVTSVGGYRIESIDDIFSELENPERMVKDPFDALEMACVYYSRNAYGRTGYSITDVERLMAKQIREYYHKKLMVRNLKGKPLSKFRQDLATYLQNGYTDEYPEKFKGLIHRLPEFYHYDTAVDDMRLISNNTSHGQQTTLGVKTLTPVKKLIRGTKHAKTHHYWFHDENKHLYSLVINKENELDKMFNSLFEHGQMRISAQYYPKELDDLHFSNIKNPSLVF